jgi:hypothetical protein
MPGQAREATGGDVRGYWSLSPNGAAGGFPRPPGGMVDCNSGVHPAAFHYPGGSNLRSVLASTRARSSGRLPATMARRMRVIRSWKK